MQNRRTPQRELYAWTTTYRAAWVVLLLVVALRSSALTAPDQTSVELVNYAHQASWYLFLAAVGGVVIRRLLEEARQVWKILVPEPVTRALVKMAQSGFSAAAGIVKRAWVSWRSRG